MISVMSLVKTETELGTLRCVLFFLWGSSSLDQLLAQQLSLVIASLPVKMTLFSLINLVVAEWRYVINGGVARDSRLNVDQTELGRWLTLSALNVLQDASALLLALPPVLVFGDRAVSRTGWGALPLLG